VWHSMEQLTTHKYYVRNIDCANCAARIEKSLNELDEVVYASLDFASQTLHVKTDDLDRIIEMVHDIEPEVELIPREAPRSPGESGSTSCSVRRELLILSVAAGLFGLVLFFEHFHPETAWTLPIACIAYLLSGWNVLLGALRTIRKRILFDENVLMVIATLGAFAIDANAEAIAVMIFYKAGEMLQEIAVHRSRRSVKALLAARPDKANLRTAAGIIEVKPESVGIDDVIVIKPGEKIPLDGDILEGRARIDTSALTGEAKPVSAGPGDGVLAGEICRDGALTVKVTRLFENSSIAKVMALVEDATARKAKTERFITTFARYYTPGVVFLAAGIALAPPILGGASFETWIYRALVMLVISCPCALVVSIPLGYFGGIGRASRRGILVKGSNYLDALAAVKTVVFDKTGTLTEGVFDVIEVANLNGFSKRRLLAFAAAAEHQSNHPIAASIKAAFEKYGDRIDPEKISAHTEHTGKGVTVRYDGHDILVGNDKFLHHRSIEHHRCDFDATVAHVAVDGHYAGYIILGDRIKAGSMAAVEELKHLGVDHIAMLTGDNACAAGAISARLKLDSYYADLFPEEKVTLFERISNQYKQDGKSAYVGDGINDAPVIARADVGIAMGALGSDAAVETADVVLMTDSPRKTAEAIAIARLTRRIVWQNIVLAFTIKAIFLTFGAFGMASMWAAVFADMGTALAAIANSTRIIGRRQPQPPMPE